MILVSVSNKNQLVPSDEPNIAKSLGLLDDILADDDSEKHRKVQELE